MAEKELPRSKDRVLGARPKYEGGIMQKPIGEALLSVFGRETFVVQRGHMQSIWHETPFQKQQEVDPDSVATYEVRAGDQQEAAKMTEGVFTRMISEVKKS
jgi:hypothetical protein